MTNITLTDGLVNGIGGTIGGGIFFLVGDLVMQNGSNIIGIKALSIPEISTPLF